MKPFKHSTFGAGAFLACLLLLAGAGCKTTPERPTPPKEGAADIDAPQTPTTAGQMVQDEKELTRLIDESREKGDLPRTVLYLQNLALLRMTKGDADAAIETLERALTISRKTGEKIQTSSLLVMLGKISGDRGEYERAIALFREAIGMDDESGNRLGKAIAANNAGKIHYLMNDYATAMKYYLAALEIMIDIGDRGRAAVVLENIRLLEQARGNR